MANWYVDSAAVGTNSGDTPANAAWNITSLTFAAASAGVAPGDFVWVRRTWCSTAGIFIGRSGWNVNSQPLMYIVGWPNSGDPFYDIRPGEARSAGWDADAAPFTNVPYPYFSSSRAALQIPVFQSNNRGFHITNFAWVASNALSRLSFGQEVGQTYGKWFIWNHLFTSGDAEDITYCTSHAETTGTFIDECYINRLHITQSCNITTGLFGNIIYIGEVFNDCNSVNAFGVRRTGACPANVGVVRGNPFTSDDAIDGFAASNTRYQSIHVENWFGAGPRRLGAGLGGYTTFVANSVTASYSGVNSAGANATAMQVRSSNPGVQSMLDFQGGANQYGGTVFDTYIVQSGVTYEATLPLYITRASCVDAFKNGFLQVAGGASKIERTHVIPGTPARWQGQSIGAAGSAYLMRFQFTAFDTTTAHLQGWPGVFVNPQTCYIHVAPFFEVRTV